MAKKKKKRRIAGMIVGRLPGGAPDVGEEDLARMLSAALGVEVQTDHFGFEQMEQDIRSKDSTREVRGVLSEPTYCKNHPEHRDGVAVFRVEGDYLERAREATERPDLKIIGISTYDGSHGGSAHLCLIDVEAAKRLVNHLSELIGLAEAAED